MGLKVKIKVGQAYITRATTGKSNPFISIRSGLHKTKTKTSVGLDLTFSETLELETDDKQLTLKVKDRNLKCFGGCGSFSILLGETEIDISRISKNPETIEGFYSLTWKNQPAGKVYLTITPLRN